MTWMDIYAERMDEEMNVSRTYYEAQVDTR